MYTKYLTIILIIICLCCGCSSINKSNHIVNGELFYENGDIKYKGELENDLPNGLGKSYLLNGLVAFSGEWKNGCPWNGEGEGNTFKVVNGKEYGVGAEWLYVQSESHYNLNDISVINDMGFVNAKNDEYNYIKQRFIVVGDEGTILTSDNGINWRTQKSKVTSSLNAILAIGSMVIAVGDNGIVISSINGVEWVVHQLFDKINLYDIEYGGGKIILVGEKGTIITLKKVDGILCTDTIETSIIESNITSINYNGDEYIAISEDGDILHSKDGSQWSINHIKNASNLSGLSGFDKKYYMPSKGVVYTMDFNGVITTITGFDSELKYNVLVNGFSKYYVIGEKGSVFTSQDMITWNKQDSGTNDELNNMILGDGRIIAIGNNGTIIVSDCLWLSEK